jgi:hypothetical protein
MSAVNTPTIPKYHKPLDWTGINYRVYLFASVRRGAGIRVCGYFTTAQHIIIIIIVKLTHRCINPITSQLKKISY